MNHKPCSSLVRMVQYALPVVGAVPDPTMKGAALQDIERYAENALRLYNPAGQDTALCAEDAGDLISIHPASAQKDIILPPAGA